MTHKTISTILDAAQAAFMCIFILIAATALFPLPRDAWAVLVDDEHIGYVALGDADFDAGHLQDDAIHRLQAALGPDAQIIFHSTVRTALTRTSPANISARAEMVARIARAARFDIDAPALAVYGHFDDRAALFRTYADFMHFMHLMTAPFVTPQTIDVQWHDFIIRHTPMPPNAHFDTPQDVYRAWRSGTCDMLNLIRVYVVELVETNGYDVLEYVPVRGGGS